MYIVHKEYLFVSFGMSSALRFSWRGPRAQFTICVRIKYDFKNELIIFVFFNNYNIEDYSAHAMHRE